MSTLFGHLAARMTNQVENLATESLLYVLQSSPEARRLLTDFLRQSGSALPDSLHFRSQAADADGAIPDIAGDAADGTTPALIEAKFWAGLTEHQPNTYLARLPVGGVLTFIAPAARAAPLWPELLKRSREKAEFKPIPGPSGWRIAIDPDGKRLALTSWIAMLNWLHSGLTDAGEVSPAADVAQLRGLTQRMDDDAFLPFTSEQLTGDAPRVVRQLCRVVDDSVESLGDEVEIDKSSRTPKDTWSQYWRFFRTKGHQWVLYFSPSDWQYSGTPVSLRISRAYGEPSPTANAALLSLNANGRARFCVWQDDGLGYVQIDIPVGKELHEVVASVVAQMKEAIAIVPDVS